MFDLVFITHLPSFYKINLYSEIAKQKKLMVIFLGSGSEIRQNDFVSDIENFKYLILNSGPFEARNKLSSCLRLYKTLNSLSYKKVVLGGWEEVEFWLPALLNSRKENCLALESTVFESQQKGVKRYIKKLFLAKINSVFASGTPHKNLLLSLGYPGKIIMTLGVGIQQYDTTYPKNRPFRAVTNFLYVGRLSPEKNVGAILDFFRINSDLFLTVVGDGPLRTSLENSSRGFPNIRFLGHVPNNNLNNIYQDNQIFLLPSISETWGLVVEEAIFHGLVPVVSENVGCSIDLVKNPQLGLIFSLKEEEGFKNKIEEVMKPANYKKLKNNVDNFCITKKDVNQTLKYVYF